jgi:hypothetical protein
VNLGLMRAAAVLNNMAHQQCPNEMTPLFVLAMKKLLSCVENAEIVRRWNVELKHLALTTLGTLLKWRPEVRAIPIESHLPAVVAALGSMEGLEDAMSRLRTRWTKGD